MSTYDQLDLTQDKNTIIVAAYRLLEVVNTVFRNEAHALPVKQEVVLGGRPAFDCELVSVGYTSARTGFPGEGSLGLVRCGDPRTIDLTVTIARCMEPPKTSRVKSINQIIPTTEEINDVAIIPLQDAWILNDVPTAYGSLYLNATSGITYANVPDDAPSGGFQANRLYVSFPAYS